MKALALAVFAATLTGPAMPGQVAEPAPVAPNDNRTPAGRLQGDTLALDLVLDLATWRPEGPDGPSVVVPALAEAGRAPQIPAPLIRVPAGTIIRATVRNALDSAYVLQGLFTRPGRVADTVQVAPGATRRVTFAAGEPGTYLYAAVPLGYVPPSGAADRNGEREQAAGALIVDPPGGSAPDRVLVVNIWGDPVDSTGYRNALTVNGLSWPHTERIDAQTGDTIRWRVVNASQRAHPMHMHGFYFTVEGLGSLERDRTLAPADQWLAVTQNMQPYTTMVLSWMAERPGNWLFHCHLAFHVVPSTRLGAREAIGDGLAHEAMSHDATKHMAGLVLGMRVRPGPRYADAPREGTAHLRLLAQEGARRGRAPRAMGYVLQRGDQPPARDSIEIPGSVIVLTRGRPADMTVVNHISEPVAVHWHGLELESWSDGVAGWSGADTVVAPAIAPGDSFVARLTVPRAGTFIYHTHMNDVEQITSGLYGAIVVLEPGQVFDPATDHVYVIGWDGAESARVLVNGDSLPAPRLLAAADTHRFRFVNISPANAQTIQLRRDTTLVAWRRVAVDGADLAPSQATLVPATHRIAVGQTADFDVRLAPGRYRLTWQMGPRRKPVVQQLDVR
jgi:FtsP/CotA-like multicopper oxidase with cupredoxin domain